MVAVYPPVKNIKIPPIEARKKAIYKLTGKQFQNNATSQEVSDYVTENIYRSEMFQTYQVLFSEYRLIERPAFKEEDYLFSVEVAIDSNLTPDNNYLRKSIIRVLEGKPSSLILDVRKIQE
ncbi:hypothetical protein [Parabacteroides sp. PF5-9]|uniref:hypothetical protein n=1 Tax=Parabacteroides sp. PF5-9 TaxID=1742404 RepID=UPI0024737610|nr:hypothetical protein [Parabacteroides sp. PF5-9]